MRPLPGRIGQIGYVVRDSDQALATWLELGAGPWFVIRARRQRAIYRGEPCNLTLSIAVANSGELQIEILHQEEDTPSIFAEFLASGHDGLFTNSLGGPKTSRRRWITPWPPGPSCGRAARTGAPASPTSSRPPGGKGLRNHGRCQPEATWSEVEPLSSAFRKDCPRPSREGRRGCTMPPACKGRRPSLIFLLSAIRWCLRSSWARCSGPRPGSPSPVDAHARRANRGFLAVTFIFLITRWAPQWVKLPESTQTAPPDKVWLPGAYDSSRARSTSTTLCRIVLRVHANAHAAPRPDADTSPGCSPTGPPPRGNAGKRPGRQCRIPSVHNPNTCPIRDSRRDLCVSGFCHNIDRQSLPTG